MDFNYSKQTMPNLNAALYIKEQGRCLFLGLTDLNDIENNDKFIKKYYLDRNVYAWYQGKEFCVHEATQEE